MRYSLKKRIISLVLCLSMIAPIITQHAPVYAMTLSDYEDNIGCTATFNTTTGEETYLVTESEPNDSWGKESLVFFAYEIPADLMLEIVSVKIVTEKYEGFNESGGTQLIERQSLWYQVKLHSGTMPDAFSDGYWVMQNFLNKEDIYEYDSLIIYPKASVAVYDANGNKVDAINMPQFEKPEFTANSTLGESADYQWQIQYQKNSWVDIQGETSKTVKLSYGMLAELLNDAGVAYIRCKSTSNTKIAYSDVIPVTVEMYQPKDPDVVVSNSFTSSSGETVTVTVVGILPEDASVQLDETDSSGVDVKPGETVTAALDISIKNADGSEWQPESGEVVTVSLEADKIGLKNGDKFVVYHLHNDEVKVLGSYVVVNNTVTFNVDGFSKFVFALTTQTVFSEDFEANIGKIATINADYENFDAYTDPRSGEYPVALQQGKDYSEGIEFIIKDVYVSNIYPYSIYYQVEIESGEISSEKIDAPFWIYQGHQDEDPSWGTLVMREFPVDEEPQIGIVADGQAVTEITVSKNNKIALTAIPTVSGKTDYTWQLLIPGTDMWVNISGQTDANCIVNYGMVANRLDSYGKAYIRCIANVNETELISDVIAVNVDFAYSIKKDARNFTAASNATYAVARAAENDTTIHNVVINYVYENGKTAETSFTSTIGVTGHLNTKVVFPTILGYLPYVDDVRMDEYTFDLKGSDMTQDFVMNVVYKPTLVDYTVVVMQQNVHNDSYTEFESKTLQALTGTVITGDMQVDISYPGFYQLLHNQVTIAADGSTVIEVRFDRYYYLMTFELGEGGYGVLPVYARCGTEVEVNNPTRPGYVFTHWSNPQGETVTFPMEMPTHDTVITANWTPSSAKYSVVYWKENADPNSDGTYGYTYWGSTIVDSISGTVVSGKDDIPTSITNATVNGNTVNEKKYFTYNDSLTDKNVVVKGDGSTVVNVYYTRNYYTIYFTGYGKCCLDEHTHVTGCNSKLICTLEEHTHGTTCNRVLSCTIPVHSAHSSDCLICGKTEHLAHTNDCLRCTHSHALSCFSVGNYGNLRQTDKPTDSSIPSNPVNGTVYSYTTGTGWFSETHYYLYLDGVWYCAYYRNGMSGNYTKSDTTRISNCSHSHTTECYKDELHTHISSCYKDVIHAHNESCYKYSCGKVNHTHGSDCYSDCTKPAHSHGNSCNSNNTNNVIHVITAKYDADISEQWPTYDKLAELGYHYKDSDGNVEDSDGDRFRGWSIDGISATATSKRFNMTSDLCDASDDVKYATAIYGYQYYVHLYYMFESFDQSNTAETNTRKKYNNVWYDSEPAYYQNVYGGSSSFNQKEIMGMSPAGKQSSRVTGDEYNNWLYYDRNRSSLKYQNIDTVIETKSDIMFGETLKDYQYTANAGIPPYPSSLEAGAYEFAGWYTTAGCYKGTEVNFDTATMPNGDMVLYAKWEPVTHTVQFYAQKDNSGNLLEKIGDTYEVKHNQKLNEQYIPKAPEDFDNGAYSFNGWWYMDGNTEQRFDFKSLPVTRDLVVYAKWTSNKLIQYEFHFQLADGTPVADSVYGSDLAGNTITYDAKGGTSLYSKYRTGYFPNTPSHSLTLNIDDEDGVLSYTFVYSAAGKVPYTVHYVTEKLKDGGTSLGTIEIGNKSYFILASTKTVADNQLAYVSENFVSVPGYVPDKFQKNLVIVPDRDNTIVFYYTADEKNAPYKVTHYIQNLDGQTWTVEYTYTGITEIGSLYSENPLTNLVGFTYAPDQSTSSGTVSANGLELNLYYVRNEYPYKVVYKVQSTGQVIYTSDTKTEMYGKIVSATAPSEYNGIYSRVSEATLTATIRVESDPKNPQYNVITFFYEEKEVTINYEVEGPAGCGTVSSESETFRISSNSASGSVAKPSSDVYKFVGWYTDKNCTNKVSDDATFVPQKPEGQWADEITYYAKFEYNLTSLTIKKQGHDTVDVNQTFIFTVKGIEGTNTEGIDLTVTIHGNGEITITDLPVGDYVIIEHTDWSWRYEAAEEVKQITVLPVEANSVVFNNTRAEIYWLDGDYYAVNIFKKKED